MLTSAQSSEHVSHDTPQVDSVLGHPITSHSQLTLVDTRLGREHTRPLHLLIDSVTVTQVSPSHMTHCGCHAHHYATPTIMPHPPLCQHPCDNHIHPQLKETSPLADVLPGITNTLKTCSPSSDCIPQLCPALRQLSSADVSTLLSELDVPVSQKLVLVDALVYDGSPNSEALQVWISADEQEELVMRVLLHLTTGRISPNQLVRC